jgi:hypothetical protein
MDALTMMMMQGAAQNGLQPQPDPSQQQQPDFGSMFASSGPGPAPPMLGAPPSPQPGMPSSAGPNTPPGLPPGVNMPATNPARVAMPTPVSAVLAQPAREPGHVKRMLMDFMYGGTQALKKFSGLPTDAEEQQQQLENQLKIRNMQMQSQMQQAQMANMVEDNQRQREESLTRQQQQQQADAERRNNPKNWSAEERTTYGTSIGLKGDALTRFKATGELPTNFGNQDLSTSPFETALKLYGPEKAVQMFKPKGTQVSVAAPNADTGNNPLTNSSEERFAQMRAAGKLTDQQINSMYPGKAGMAAKQRIMVRAAGLGGGNLNTALTAPAQKSLTAASNALANLDRLEGIIKENKLENTNEDVLAMDRLRYQPITIAGVTVKAGHAAKTPLGKHMAGLSFGALQSAAALMSQTGSRAWQTLQEALKHPPTANDSPKLMMDKIRDLRTKLNYAIQESKTYGAKSGLVSQPDDTGAIPPATPPPSSSPTGWGSFLSPKSKRIGAQ